MAATPESSPMKKMRLSPNADVTKRIVIPPAQAKERRRTSPEKQFLDDLLLEIENLGNKRYPDVFVASQGAKPNPIVTEIQRLILKEDNIVNFDNATYSTAHWPKSVQDSGLQLASYYNLLAMAVDRTSDAVANNGSEEQWTEVLRYMFDAVHIVRPELTMLNIKTNQTIGFPSYRSKQHKLDYGIFLQQAAYKENANGKWTKFKDRIRRVRGDPNQNAAAMNYPLHPIDFPNHCKNYAASPLLCMVEAKPEFGGKDPKDQLHAVAAASWHMNDSLYLDNQERKMPIPCIANDGDKWTLWVAMEPDDDQTDCATPTVHDDDADAQSHLGTPTPRPASSQSQAADADSASGNPGKRDTPGPRPRGQAAPQLLYGVELGDAKTISHAFALARCLELVAGYCEDKYLPWWRDTVLPGLERVQKEYESDELSMASSVKSGSTGKVPKNHTLFETLKRWVAARRDSS